MLPWCLIHKMPNKCYGQQGNAKADTLGWPKLVYAPQIPPQVAVFLPLTNSIVTAHLFCHSHVYWESVKDSG